MKRCLRLVAPFGSFLLLVGAYAAYFAAPLSAQQVTLTQPIGNTDQGIPLPSSGLTLNTSSATGLAMPVIQQDPTALREITSYRSAINLTTWKDLKGTGVLTSTAAGQSNQNDADNATLWIRERGGYRLDVQESKGTRSTRVDGTYGSTQHADGKIRSMDARDAVTGLLACGALMESTFPQKDATVLDRGMISVDGITLHRLTVEAPWPDHMTDSKGNLTMSVTDLYFDPQIHLLSKSATMVFGSAHTGQALLRVMTYGNYSSVNGTLIPFQYRETLNGQILWTLQLKQAQSNQGLSYNEFHF